MGWKSFGKRVFWEGKRAVFAEMGGSGGKKGNFDCNFKSNLVRLHIIIRRWAGEFAGKSGQRLKIWEKFPMIAARKKGQRRSPAEGRKKLPGFDL